MKYDAVEGKNICKPKEPQKNIWLKLFKEDTFKKKKLVRKVWTEPHNT